MGNQRIPLYKRSVLVHLILKLSETESQVIFWVEKNWNPSNWIKRFFIFRRYKSFYELAEDEDEQIWDGDQQIEPHFQYFKGKPDEL